jgi:HlyD family secretion protein
MNTINIKQRFASLTSLILRWVQTALSLWKTHCWPSLPDHQTPSETIRLDLARHLTFGLGICGFLFFGVLGWSSFSSLSSAVVAHGILAVESHVKKVQHHSGGIVAELHVKEGDTVRAGDLLMRLDATTAQTSHSIVNKTLHELSGRRARLEAERDGDTVITFPESLSKLPEVTEHIRAGEERLFSARREAHEAQDSQLKERILQMSEQIRGLDVQSIATKKQIEITEKETENVIYLHKLRLRRKKQKM